MKFNKTVCSLALCVGLVAAGAANAAVVSCGNSALGVRLAVVDPGLVGGLCYAKEGNLQNADITGRGLFQIEKDNKDGVGAEAFGAGTLMSTMSTDATSGTWTFDGNVWNIWDKIYLGFHFGNANGKDFQSTGNPDSFIVQLARPDAMGTWALAGTNAKLNGLSNMHLLRGADACKTNCGGGGGGSPVPEPGSLALLGLGLLGLAAARRKSAAA